MSKYTRQKKEEETPGMFICKGDVQICQYICPDQHFYTRYSIEPIMVYQIEGNYSDRCKHLHVKASLCIFAPGYMGRITPIP